MWSGNRRHVITRYTIYCAIYVISHYSYFTNHQFQLGVSANLAIANGGLANNPAFFGSSTAEIGSNITTGSGWNSDHLASAFATAPWFTRGGGANSVNGAGVFEMNALGAGGVNSSTSHRTILLGY